MVRLVRMESIPEQSVSVVNGVVPLPAINVGEGLGHTPAGKRWRML